jgi:hypothetical protein
MPQILSKARSRTARDLAMLEKKTDPFLEDSNTAVSEVVEYRIKECERSE